MNIPDRSADSAQANHMRWDGAARGHYEVWYLTANHRSTGLGLWIRYTLEAPKRGLGEPYAQLWCAVFDRDEPSANFAIHRRYPISQLVAARDPFALTIGSSELHDDRARGALSGEGHEVSWDLKWTPAACVRRLFPSLMYRRGGLGETTVLSPTLGAGLEGAIVVDGRRLELRGETVGQTHLWGRKHAHAWAWGHCSEFIGGRAAILECLTVRLRRLGCTLPPMTMLLLELDGELHRFTRFFQVLTGRTSAELSTGRYAFTARSSNLRLVGEFSARVQDMVVAPYVDPDGAPSYCANTEVGDLEIVVERRSGRRWEHAATLRAQGTAHFELGERERDPAILADHIAV